MINDAPTALNVLSEELAAIEQRFAVMREADDGGERDARIKDLVTSIDRYIRLEVEVFYPVLRRNGIDAGPASARHADLRRAIALVNRGVANEAALGVLQDAFQVHRNEQERSTFPLAERALGEELPALALELDEVRQRMSGAYGV